MRVIILNPTLMGGVWYHPKPTPQTVSDDVGRHLIQIGVAREYETKEQAPQEKKALSVSPAGQASQNPTPRRRGRPRGGKSTSSTTTTD